MNIEKSNLKVFNIVIIVVLVAVLLTVFGGFLMQQNTIPMRSDRMDRGFAPLQSESAQTGPTGALALSVGIFLLSVGFVVLVIVLWLGNRKLHPKEA